MSSAQQTPPRRGRRKAVLVPAVAGVAVLAAGGVVLASRADHDRQAAPRPTPVATRAPSSTPPLPRATTSAPAPKTSTTATTRPAAPHDVVAPAAPVSFRYAGKGFTIRAGVCGMENVRPLDPPGEQHHTVCWVQHDFGYAPASKGRAKGTTYVLGHSWGQDAREVLNRLSERATKQALPAIDAGRATRVDGVPTYPVTALDGNVLTLVTGRGTLTYTVRDAYAVAKSQAGNVTKLVDENVANRVVLITCAELHHTDYDYNIVVEAYLTSSAARPATT